MTVVFARGTLEPGNVGALVGPPFFQAIEAAAGPGKMVVQGVDYPADVPGFLAGGDPNGSAKMASLVMQAMSACPNTKVVMAGYSQGGQLVHNAANMLPASVMAQVNSAVIFGDPNNGTAVTNLAPAKTKVICHPDDNICQQGIVILPAHLTYGNLNAAEAAAFVVQAAGMA
ncbi:cutinase [Zopfochytrium polystomum]|nr:cutinase [Zopfochytrium polystomum]